MTNYELERRELQRKIDALLSKPSLTASEQKQADLLMSQVANLRSDEERQLRLAKALESCGLPYTPPATGDKLTQQQELESFRKYVAYGETRTYSPLSSDPASIGALVVPATFYSKLLTGISQYTELMAEENVTLIQTDKGNKMTLPQLGLDSITAAIAVQGTDLLPVANPNVSSLSLGGFSYRTNPIAATIELEQYSFESITTLLVKAFSTGLARGIGSDLVLGSGSGAPLGVLAAATDSTVVSSGSGGFSVTDLRAVYAKVNRAYRVSPKCAWLMNDATYQAILELQDTTGRPLVKITEDGERIFGKKILVSPDMPTAAGSKALCFGDFAQYLVRVVRNGVLVRRNQEVPSYAEKGVSLYTAYMRVDSALNAPGSVTPIVYAKLHA
jgi:HK97 family phage major capsid protein